MKPLVMYCRWQSAKLRLRGREETAVFGQLIFNESGTERSQKFHFNLKNSLLTLKTDEGEQVVQLDNMGVAVEES